ncbi:hypothetical protein D9547_03275 [Geobacillus stearothermophilus]|uniref:Uncharacterized protein n=1 Tax=Geobacillus stearothermophilus TaxID=1422 RepID=A0A3L7D0J5_GEOSE|nr:hypothetical protein D9549_03060 [Geobacillus stearothermophilus]RLQ12009.1 hypothetical protein D9547_03275 [Geobacillus stearothermophilus]RLQ13977.1 hypothetical protein D9548_08505 [Geobacillus stearothermophilus]
MSRRHIRGAFFLQAAVCLDGRPRGACRPSAAKLPAFATSSCAWGGKDDCIFLFFKFIVDIYE